MLLSVSRRRSNFPTGIIFPFKDTSIPTGWERATEMDDKHIIGAGDTYAVAATGGDSVAEISITSSSAGGHTGTTTNDMIVSEGAVATEYSTTGSESAGAHTHVLSANYIREYQQLLFIRATEDHQTLPANAVILTDNAASPVSGLTGCYTDDRILRAGASIANAGGSLTDKACSSSGEHIHGRGTLRFTGTGHSVNRNVYAGAHTHSSYTLTLEDEELKRAYLTAWYGSSAFLGASGIIAMWEEDTAPSGWHLCDGNDGFIDLQDYFIILSATETAGDSYDESNRIQLAGTLPSVTWEHNHVGSALDVFNVGTTGYHTGDDEIAHSHTIATAWKNYTPVYYALTFIQKV